MNIFLYVLSACALLIVLSVAGAVLYGYLRPERVRASQARAQFPTYRPIDGIEQTAVLIACHNGAGTIGTAVSRALDNGVDVYVVSDASTDDTAKVAAAAGAQVLALTANVGKPAALHAAYVHFDLGRRCRAVTILDDDVMIEPDFVARCLDRLGPRTAIVVGRNLTWWPREKRWNLWLANRAYSYWNYQVTIRWIQSALNVMNCISGSNSIYRIELLDVVLPTQPPYIVDDTYWVLETHRRELGRVVYAPRARAFLQDPTTFADWYRQNVRWMWGTFQGVIGHRIGTRLSHFDLAYLALILHWLLYVVGAPVLIFGIIAGTVGMGPVLALTIAAQVVWITAAAWRLRHPRLVLFLPLILVTDLLYRVVMVHGLVKAIRQPTVDSCKWTSPARIGTAPPRVVSGIGAPVELPDRPVPAVAAPAVTVPAVTVPAGARSMDAPAAITALSETGWEISDLATELEIHPSTVYRWRAGTRRPAPANLNILHDLVDELAMPARMRPATPDGRVPARLRLRPATPDGRVTARMPAVAVPARVRPATPAEAEPSRISSLPAAVGDRHKAISIQAATAAMVLAPGGR